MTAERAPVWFLDLDGVVNALPVRGAQDLADHQRYDIEVVENGVSTTTPIRVRRAVVDFINQAHREGLADMRWLTNWGKYARIRFAPTVGLDDFAVGGDPPPCGSPERRAGLPTWWKLAALPGSGRYVFTDDGLDGQTTAHLRACAAEPPLLIKPLGTFGLEDWHLQRINAYLRGTPV